MKNCSGSAYQSQFVYSHIFKCCLQFISLFIVKLKINFTDPFNQPHHLCLVVYYIPEDFKPPLLPHGNSRQETPFFPTLPSTIAVMKKQCASGSGPKDTVGTVSAMVGGVVSARDACELPRNEQQVSDLKQRQKKKPLTCSASNDELSVVMHKAFLEDSRFIREVRTLHEPAIVVALDRQLDDLVRFCCKKDHFGILTIDPTFSLGAFDVTITTYRHLLLQSRRTSNHPAFIGPVMVHFRKTFATYLFFGSTLIGLRPSLSSLQCFGTDGELALYQAFQHSCPSATHLLCCNHMRRNLNDKLRELGVKGVLGDMILQDVFGKQVRRID